MKQRSFTKLLAVLFWVENVLLEEPLGPREVHVHNYGGACCIETQSGDFQDKFLNNITSNVRQFLDKIASDIADLRAKPFARRPKDCQDIQALGKNTTGVYTIFPDGTDGFKVRCDMETTGGGWTVFQRRVSDSDFYKGWVEYQFGFGNLSGNFWLGNQQIHTISSQGWYQLRVDLGAMDGQTAFAEYKLFKLDGSSTAYQLQVEGYNGNAGDSLTRQNGMKFTTKDKDNDSEPGNCAEIYSGAWWYEKCHDSNLNGAYGNNDFAEGPVWKHWRGYYEPLPFTEMKIRRWND